MCRSIIVHIQALQLYSHPSNTLSFIVSPSRFQSISFTYHLMKANMLEGCFVDKVSESVKLIDALPPNAQSQSSTRSCQFSSLEDLGEFFDKPENQTYSCRFM